MKVRVAILLTLSALVLMAAAPPPDLGDFAYQQRPGNQLPLDTAFRDDTGRSVALRDLLGGKPAILALVYFHCPNLCGIVRTDLFDALAKSGMTAGRDYTLIALSIDSSETVEDAKEAKADDLSRYPLPGGQQASHFLTGSADSVQAVADAVGFRCVRVAQGGEILEAIKAPEGLGIFACALGGEDGCTLLLCAAPDFLEANRAHARAAVLLTTVVDVPHAGLP